MPQYIRLLWRITIILLISGCSGYRILEADNPFSESGINSVSIPTFVNQTIFPQVSGPFTREITLTLSRFPRLKVYPGNYSDSDAILLGIIRSSDKKKHALEFKGEVYTEKSLELRESIGEKRKGFHIPRNFRYDVSVQLVLIKRPTPELLNMVKSELGQYVNVHPQIIFNATFGLYQNIEATLNDNRDVDYAGPLNFTQTRGKFIRGINEMASALSEKFEREVLFAF